MKLKNLLEDNNAGEIANAKSEQRDSMIMRHIEETYSEVGNILGNLVTRLTAKQWRLGEFSRYSMTKISHLDVKNPGRLKGYKFSNKTEEKLEVYEEIFNTSEARKYFKKIKIDTTWGNVKFEYNGAAFEASSSGKGKADIRISSREDMWKWAEKDLD